MRVGILLCCLGLLLGCSVSEEIYSPGVEGGVTAVGAEGMEDKTFEEKVAIQEEIIRRQEAEIERLGRELEDLRRQKFHNEALRRYERQ